MNRSAQLATGRGGRLGPILVLILLILSALPVLGQTDLSEAAKNAKEAREKRKKSTTKVITNADVKKSKGKVVVGKPAPEPVAPAGPSLAEQYETTYRNIVANREKVAAVAKTVASLEKELAAIETQYYEENDLDRRDREIVVKFNETRAKLEAARKELAQLTPAEPPAPTAQPEIIEQP